MSPEIEAFEKEARRLLALPGDEKDVFDLKCALSKQLEGAHYICHAIEVRNSAISAAKINALRLQALRVRSKEVPERALEVMKMAGARRTRGRKISRWSCTFSAYSLSMGRTGAPDSVS